MANKKNIKEIKITIEGDEWVKALDKAFDKKNKEVTIAGFRKGKAPRNVYEKKYGKESLFFDASDFVIQDAYMKALTQLGDESVPVAQPKVDITNISDEKIEFNFTFITKPDVNV